MSTDTLDRVDEELVVDTTNGDHDTFAHFVRQSDIIEATFNGKAVKALCGKVWVASKSPEGKKVCPECKDIYDGLEAE